jgi:hypothetical protein
MNNERQQVNEQKQDGQTQTTGVVKGELFLSRRAVRFAANPILQNFMWMLQGDEQTAPAKSVTKTAAKNVGTQDHQLIGGRQEVTSTVSPKNFWLICTKSKTGAVPFVVKYQKQSAACMSIIAMKLGLFEAFCATAATRGLGLLKIAPNSSSKQSLIFGF